MEWYHPWANLAPTLTQYMDEQDEVLVCGCGNSEMSVDMYDDGEIRGVLFLAARGFHCVGEGVVRLCYSEYFCTMRTFLAAARRAIQ